MLNNQVLWRMLHAKPSAKVRVATAVLIAAFGALVISSTYKAHPKFTSDFGNWHLAARAFLSGDDPYLTTGPRGFKYEWPTLFVYPATVIILAIPFTWLTEPLASSIFVAISTFVMVMAITKRGPYLLTMLATPVFQMSVALGQWSLLLTAGIFYPVLAFLAVVKPNAGLPIAAAVRDRRALICAGLIGVGLLAASLVMIPRWPMEWLSIVRNDDRYLAPITRVGGFLMPLALLRWRRREAWLLLGMAILPQSLTFYCLLPLFTIPRNLYESASLATVSTLGIYAGAALMPHGMTGVPFYEWSGNVAILSTYIPCLALLLIRENAASDDPRLIRLFRDKRDSFHRLADPGTQS
jgi:hypothetical protein